MIKRNLTYLGHLVDDPLGLATIDTGKSDYNAVAGNKGTDGRKDLALLGHVTHGSVALSEVSPAAQ